ncbi:MAG: hypothetical protein KF760_00910 [Candidatus Eremiobacteraeota bacterium]|nr:hypothetical protein [Candidatus Eremiobacteraeota bacterium]MCW5871999.1 hypothetical protein [Candidatus Eremiobacteraeota bacterium]
MLPGRPAQLVVLWVWLLALWVGAEPLSLGQVVEEARDGVYNRFWLDGVEAEEGFSLEQVAGCQWLAVQLDHPQADDGLLAAGVALALNKPSVYLVMGREQLPYFLRQADKVRPGQVLIPGPSEQNVAFRSLQAPLASLDRPVDSFIGSLMSNLNNFEYGEAQLHLQAIRDALLRVGGRRAPYCEALNVARPADFDSPAKALAQDLAALKKAENCVFYLYDGKSRPSGMWVEVGAALAWNKPSILLTPSLEALPPALRLPQRNLRVVVYQTRQHLIHQLQGDDARALVVP